MANGRVDGDQAHGDLRNGQTGGSTASTTGTAVAKPQSRERPEPGVRKDVAGQRFSSDGRHSRSQSGQARSRESVWGDLGGSWDDSWTCERSRHRGRGDRGVRGSVRTHYDGKTTPTAMNRPIPTDAGLVRPAEASLRWRASGKHLACENRESGTTHRDPARRGYWYEEVRWQKSVRRIARRFRSASRKASRRGAAGRGALRMTCWRRPRRPRGENGAHVTPRYPNKDGERGRGARGDPGSAWHDGRHPDCGPDVPKGAAGRRSRSRGSNAGCTSQGVRFASFRSVLEPARRCPRWRRGMSEIGVVRGKGCSSRWGAGGPSLEAPWGVALELLGRGFADLAWARPRARESRTGRSKLAGANS